MTATHATLQRSQEFHRAGAFCRAESLYQQILQADPDQLDARHLLGVVALQLGRGDAAVDRRDAADLGWQAEKLGNVNLALIKLTCHGSIVPPSRLCLSSWR
jgi:thioredoxin-like negative regulator of GroEL